MGTRQSAVRVSAVLLLALAAVSAGVTAQQKDTSAARADAAALPARIWQDPGKTASLDLRYGAGGKAHAPDATGTFTFVSEDSLATSPKFSVVDGQGVEWKVKLGQESQSETAATRFLWAAGYFVDDDYFMAELTVKGLPTLRRGDAFVSSGGIVHGARLERKPTTVEKVGDWDWFDNPFLGQRELNGLRVMMALVNNWDLKAVNNAIYVVGGERHYAIGDLGASFGKTGRLGTQSKGVPKDYADSKFIKKVTPDYIHLVFHSRPIFLFWAFAHSNYDERTKMEQITKHIPRADAKWLGQRLSRLTDDQIRDGFRSAGYGAGDVETLTRAIRTRITALEAL
jgi:hypothetical protein